MLQRQAPAKLNLYLRVLGRRPDGYHELETVFERIDLSDTLTFEPAASEITLTCSTPALSCGEDNLVLQAARLLQEAAQTPRGARIHLTKRIPIAAGLGGGSSDAAAALVALNQLWDLGLSLTALQPLAARLGSDVPFFLLESAFAVGRGRGERCEPASGRGTFAHVLVMPDVQLSTRDVYQGAHFDLTASTPSSTMVRHALRNGSPSELATGLWNDLEPEAIRRCPVISTSQSCLRDLGCLGVLVSGSGPSVFGLCHDLPHAHAIAARLSALQSEAPAPSRHARQPWRIEVVQTLHRTAAGPVPRPVRQAP